MRLVRQGLSMFVWLQRFVIIGAIGGLELSLSLFLRGQVLH